MTRNLSRKKQSWLLFILNRTPDISLYLLKNFKELFYQMLRKAANENNCDVILMGDINANFLNRSTIQR